MNLQHMWHSEQTTLFLARALTISIIITSCSCSCLHQNSKFSAFNFGWIRPHFGLNLASWCLLLKFIMVYYLRSILFF